MKFAPKSHHSRWATDFSFYTFPAHKEIFVPKDELQTYADLLEILEIETNIKMEHINIAKNLVIVSYAWNTPIEDIEIKKEDLCYILKKPQSKNQRERDEAIKEQKLNQKKSEDRLKSKLQSPEYKKLVETVYGSPDKLKLLKELSRQYSKDECLYALCDYGNDIGKARAALSQGECLRKFERRVFEEERAYLKDFLNNKNQQQIKRLLRENNHPVAFVKIMQKLYEKYPKFKEIEPKHQAFVQKQLFGRTLEPEQDDEPDEEGLPSDVSKALWRVEGHKRPRELIYEDEKKFKDKLKADGKDEDEIDEIFKISHNNIEWAEALLKAEEIDTSEKINPLCLKKSNRINLVMQFFSHPKFHKITEGLRGDPKKAQSFISHVLQKVKDNITLHQLIKQYREQAIILLTGVNISKEKQSKADAIELEFKQALPLEEQKKEKAKIESSYDKQLFDILRRKSVNTVLAASALRATENNLENMIKYLALGGVNRNFDFCPAGQKPEQIYIYKKWRKQKTLLNKLKTTKNYVSWLAHVKEVRPLMYDMIIRNKFFFDKMIQGEVEKKK